jgi:voltage-gated potassium channel
MQTIKKIANRLDHPLWLLTSLIVLLLAHPLFEQQWAKPFFYSLLLTITVVCGGVTAFQSKEEKIELTLGLMALLLTWLHLFLPVLKVAAYFSLCVFFIYTVYLLIGKIIQTPAVNARLLYSTINAYMLVGLTGALLAGIIHHFNALAFNMPAHIGQPHFDDFIYFSFVTLGTLGYGDITPITSTAQSLAIFLSIAGQTYFAMIVALAIDKYKKH